MFSAPGDSVVGSRAQPALMLETSSREIEIGEPLFTKTTVFNRGERALWFRDEVCSQTAIIRFDLRTPDGEWRQSMAENEGIVAFPANRISVEPMRSYCAYSVIFHTGERFIFDTVGEFQIRARVQGEGFELVSRAIPLTVRAARREQFKFIAANQKLLLGYLEPADAKPLDDKRPLPFDQVPSGRIRTYLEAHNETVEWQRALPGTEHAQAAEKRVVDRIAQLDPVMKETYLRGLARRYRDEGRFRESLAALERLPDPSHASNWLRKEIERRTGISTPPQALPQPMVPQQPSQP
jgi:hypothetical protein